MSYCFFVWTFEKKEPYISKLWLFLLWDQYGVAFFQTVKRYIHTPNVNVCVSVYVYAMVSWHVGFHISEHMWGASHRVSVYVYAMVSWHVGFHISEHVWGASHRVSVYVYAMVSWHVGFHISEHLWGASHRVNDPHKDHLGELLCFL